MLPRRVVFTACAPTSDDLRELLVGTGEIVSAEVQHHPDGRSKVWLTASAIAHTAGCCFEPPRALLNVKIVRSHLRCLASAIPDTALCRCLFRLQGWGYAATLFAYAAI
eukprot:6213405-Pleurochrysis_carterae.AAC.2